MSAAKAVMEARAAGIRLGVEGNDVVLDAAAPPPPAVLDLLSRYKTAIVLWLRPGADGWSAEDWQVFFDERAGIAEFDGGLPRDQAEARAIVCCVAEWLYRNSVFSEPGRCLGCGREECLHDPLPPIGIAAAGQTWLHSPLFVCLEHRAQGRGCRRTRGNGDRATGRVSKLFRKRWSGMMGGIGSGITDDRSAP